MVQTVVNKLRENMNQVIKGKETQVNQLIMALLCEGHILLEDLPGTGKTTAAKALAKSIGCEFKRVQFTPDLLPTDLMGINFYNQKQADFIFRPGPIFTQVLLADEINRATPRTQSSLLECMEETQVTVDGQTYALKRPFVVIATQNPIETQGTFPLPEAQLDRFFIKLSMGYPTPEEEALILTNLEKEPPINSLQAVVTQSELLAAIEAIKEVKVSETIKQYIVAIANETRCDGRLNVGMSLRGSLAMLKAARAWAAMSGRNYVIPEDVKEVALAVGSHRLMLKGYSLSSSSQSGQTILEEIMAKLPIISEE